MLTKILSSESQSIQKANRRLSVAKFFKCAITLVVFVCAFSVSAFAYTETKDGVDTIYTFPMVDLNSINGGNPSGMQLTVNYQGKRLLQNGGVDYASLSRYRYIVTRDSDLQRNLIVYSSIPKEVTKNALFGTLSVTINSDRNVEPLEFNTSLEFQLSIDVPSTSGNIENDLSHMFLYAVLDDPSDPVVSMTPTIVSSSKLYDYDNHGVIYTVNRYTLSFVLDFTPSEDVSSISFKYFRLYFRSLLDNKVAEGDTVYYTQYSIGIGDVTVRSIAPEAVQNYYSAISAGNNDMKQYFGTINQVDQNIINTQKDKISQVGSSTSQLGLTSSLEESLSGQFDISQEVDVLGNSAVLGSVSDFWDLVPWDSTFVTTAIGMVGSIALLSLVLHAGGRGGALRSGGNNRNNSRKGNDD